MQVGADPRGRGQCDGVAVDGGRILVGLLPNALAYRVARLEPFGFFIVIGLMVLGVLGFFLAPFLELGTAIVGLFN